MTPTTHDLCERLFAAIAHGDEDHRAWLREAIDAFFSGQSVPAPRGQGTKEAEIARLSALVEEMEGGLGEAFGTLTYIFECGEDEHTGTAAREALDKIDLILTRIKGESMEAVWPYPQTRSKP